MAIVHHQVPGASIEIEAAGGVNVIETGVMFSLDCNLGVRLQYKNLICKGHVSLGSARSSKCVKYIIQRYQLLYIT